MHTMVAGPHPRAASGSRAKSPIVTSHPLTAFYRIVQPIPDYRCGFGKIAHVHDVGVRSREEDTAGSHEGPLKLLQVQGLGRYLTSIFITPNLPLARPPAHAPPRTATFCPPPT